MVYHQISSEPNDQYLLEEELDPIPDSLAAELDEIELPWFAEFYREQIVGKEWICLDEIAFMLSCNPQQAAEYWTGSWAGTCAKWCSAVHRHSVTLPVVLELQRAIAAGELHAVEVGGKHFLKLDRAWRWMVEWSLPDEVRAKLIQERADRRRNTRVSEIEGCRLPLEPLADRPDFTFLLDDRDNLIVRPWRSTKSATFRRDSKQFKLMLTLVHAWPEPVPLPELFHTLYPGKGLVDARRALSAMLLDIRKKLEKYGILPDLIPILEMADLRRMRDDETHNPVRLMARKVYRQGVLDSSMGEFVDRKGRLRTARDERRVAYKEPRASAALSDDDTDEDDFDL